MYGNGSYCHIYFIARFCGAHCKEKQTVKQKNWNWTNWNFDQMMVLNKNLGDHQSSQGPWKCVQKCTVIHSTNLNLLVALEEKSTKKVSGFFPSGKHQCLWQDKVKIWYMAAPRMVNVQNKGPSWRLLWNHR